MTNIKVLLIIDLQKEFFHIISKTPRFDTNGIVNRINYLSEIFRDSNFPVIFIQHDGTEMNEFKPNTTEWELLDDLNTKSNAIFIGRYANDLFYNSQLQTKLTELKINEWYI